MSQIREELILVDRFTAALTDYLRYVGQASNASNLARRAADSFSQAQRRAADSSGKLSSSLRNLVGGYLSLRSVATIVNLSDAMTQTTARLDMMNDGLQTTAELNQMIYESAQRSRGSYQATADLVSKLGTLAGEAFNNSAEIVAFSEQINKQIALSGASNQAASAALLQLTQGLSSGVLRGEELNSVLEQTPTIAQSIAKYMGVTTGEMRELASEGAVTAEVVKNAMFAAADEVNAKFEQMPMTWAQVWTSFQNTAIMALQPVLNAINWLANNIEIIGPLVLGVAGAFVVFQIAANWTKIAAAATTAYQFVVNLLSIAFGVLTGNAAASSAAVFTFNSALLASPITWVIMGVMLLVAALYAGVAAYNKFTGASISATGIIAGVIMAALAFVGNIFIALFNLIVDGFVLIYNLVATVANFIGNVFVDPVGAVARLFFDLADTVLGVIQAIASAIDTVFGFNLAGAVQGWRGSLGGWVDNTFGHGTEIMAKLNASDLHLGRFEYGAAFNTGYNWGSNLNLFGGNELPNTAFDYTPPTYEQMNDLGKSVGSIEKSVNMAEEDIKSLVDVAERRYVNRINLTAQTPVINVSGQNTGNTEADRRSLANTIRDILIEQVASGSTRSTARTY